MNKGFTFCEECRKEVAYKEVEKNLTAQLKGETYYYTGKEAICIECENEVYVAEINDYNLAQLYKEFRIQNDIIPLEHILKILDKYNIGKRPLSLLLGWGEQTFSRYCDGDMPTKQYSAILKRIYEEPAYYLQLLEENKDNLKSSLAYEKSKKAVEEVLMSVQDEEVGSKIELIIAYVLNQCEDITPLALQKILYYIQGFYYAFFGKYIIDEDCEAWLHGPVYRKIYYKYQAYRFEPIDTKEEIDEKLLSDAEKIIIDSVIKYLGCYSGKILEHFTHLETPWLAVRGDLPVGAVATRIIPKNLIGDYFVKVKEKNSMLNPSDIKIYTKKMFEQIIMS